MSKGTRTVAITTVAAVCCLAAGAAFASAGGTHAASHAKAKGLERNFSVFAGDAHQHSSASYPAGVRRLLAAVSSSRDPSNQRNGLDVAATQEVTTANGSVWLVPGSTGACAITQGQPVTVAEVTGAVVTSMGCDSLSDIQQRGLLSVSRSGAGPATVYGMVPNGTESLTATLSSGATTTISVTDNAVDASLPSLPASVVMNTTSGAVSTSLSRR
jgi:hypothetical protein